MINEQVEVEVEAALTEKDRTSLLIVWVAKATLAA